MNEYRSLYTWAMERQMSLRQEAEIRRMVRQARHQADLPTDPRSPRLRVLADRMADEPIAQKSA